MIYFVFSIKAHFYGAAAMSAATRNHGGRAARNRGGNVLLGHRRLPIPRYGTRARAPRPGYFTSLRTAARVSCGRAGRPAGRIPRVCVRDSTWSGHR